MKSLLLLIALAAGLSGTAAWSQAPAPLRTIDTLDLPRYTGRWYEIAKFPNRFQKQCVADTSAEYSARADGAVIVINRCRLANGQMEQAQGLAWQQGGATSPRLQVRFAPAWLSWLPMVWGDYWVVDLDDAYSLVAVSEPRREYLWVLSRSPVVEPARYQALLQRLAAQSLDVQRLELSAHTRP